MGGKAYRRLGERDWMLIRYEILREGETIAATALRHGVSHKTIANRKKVENWAGLDLSQNYEGIPCDEEIIDMRKQKLVNATINAISEKVQQARTATGGASELKTLAEAAKILTGKAANRAPRRAAGVENGARAGRKAPSVSDAVALLDTLAAQDAAAGTDPGPDAG
jgi:transposase-like protein